MFILPFIYFTLLTLFFWKKHEGFDVCVLMSSLYAVTSLFAAIIIMEDMLGDSGILFDYADAKFDTLPTLVYCALLTISILPFSLIYSKDLNNIKPTYPGALISLSVFLIGIALLNLYLVADSTVEILSGDLSTVRQDHYQGIESPAEVKAESMPFIIRFIYQFRYSTILALPIMFYYVCFEKKPWWFNLALFFTSLTMPIAGMQAADRTEVIFFILMLTFCIVFFRKFLSKKFKRVMTLTGLPIVLALVFYFVAVSDARFSEKKKDGGAFASALQYAGQGYLNFCFFWENAKPDLIATEREFPIINHFVFQIDSNPERRAERSGEHGFFISVFPSFIGDIMLDVSILGAIIYVMFFFVIVFLIIKRTKRDSLTFGEMIFVFSLAAIPLFGIFYYRYFNYASAFTLVISAIIYVITRIKYLTIKDDSDGDLNENKTETGFAVGKIEVSESSMQNT